VGGFLTGLGSRLSEAKLGPFDGAIAFIALYCLFQALSLPLVSYLAGTGVNIDEAEQLLYLPDFWMGYGSSQPPLYSWLNVIGAQIFGTTILSLKITKYLVLLLGALCVAASTRRLGYSRGAAAAAMLGLFTIPEIFWEMQRALTHSVAAFAFSAMMVLALVLLFEKRTFARYVFFGLATGLALLAKYNDVVLPAALVAAALSMPTYRPAILDRRFLLSVGIGALVVLPTAVWSLEHQAALFSRTYRLGIDQTGTGMLPVWLTGLREIALGAVTFSILPAGLSVLAFATERVDAGMRRSDILPGAQFVGRTMLSALAITAVLVVASGTTSVPNRWLLPFLFLLPAYAAMRAEEFGPKGRRIQHFLAGTGAVLAVLATPAIWYIQAAGGNGMSSAARLDYPAFYRMLKADGPVSTIVGDRQWIGNFRLVDPDLTLLIPQIPDFSDLMKAPAMAVWLGNRPLPAALLNKVERAGYAIDGAVHRLSVPEHLSEKGSRNAGFVRLRKIRDIPATEADVPDADPAQDSD
jgi:4-amino-4-deoxy-L-arabinose transferase-like glycosyltransferase